MTIGFILNGEDEVIRTDAERRLVDILRETFGLLGTKAGCLSGNCGVCSVILGGQVIKSCLVPAFKIQGAEIITIEGFSQTEDFKDIAEGFSRAGVENCGICDAGKIFAVEALLSKNPRPTREEALLAFHGIKCRCTESDSLLAGTLAAAQIRRERLYGRRF